MNSSRLLDKAVDQFASLPGVGRKTALKFVLHLLKKDVQEVDDFLKSIGDLKKNIKECRRCHNISDGEICEICSDPKRDNTTLCVVENIKDILSIEATSQYNGLYHVLGGYRRADFGTFHCQSCQIQLQRLEHKRNYFFPTRSSASFSKKPLYELMLTFPVTRSFRSIS